MSPLLKEKIDQLINALQLCLKEPLLDAWFQGKFGPDYDEEGWVWIQFKERPANEEQWKYFEKLVPGVWREKEMYQIEGADFERSLSGGITDFLLLTRLRKENMLKLAELNPYLRPWTEKALG